MKNIRENYIFQMKHKYSWNIHLIYSYERIIWLRNHDSRRHIVHSLQAQFYPITITETKRKQEMFTQTLVQPRAGWVSSVGTLGWTLRVRIQPGVKNMALFYNI
jgi:hypothetical protein